MKDHSAADSLLRTQVSDQQFEFLHALMADPEMSVRGAAARLGLEHSTACRWLKQSNVRQVFGELLRERKSRNEDVRQQVIVMLWRMICADPRGAYRGGCSLSPDQLPDELAACMTGATPMLHEGVVVAWKYTFSDKARLLEMILKHFDAPKNVREGAGTPVVINFLGVQGAGESGS